MRQTWVVIHRWAGLTMALFLIVAGLTGAVLPFQESLTFISRPSLSYATPPSRHTRPMDGPALALAVERQTGGKVIFVPINPAPDHVAVVGLVPRANRPPLGYDTVWVDPYTGHIRLAFRYGALADGVQNAVPFLYQLHYSLAAGQWGMWIMGAAALVWTFDCFIGLYLTFPLRRKHASNKVRTAPGWIERWRPAWRIRRHARGHKLNFDLHRAGGLWFWPLLLVFALSSVSYNLPGLYRAAMEPLGLEKEFRPAALTTPLDDPPISLSQARRLGRALMEQKAGRQGFSVQREGSLFYIPDAGTYIYSARTSLDPSYDRPQTSVWFTGTDGRETYFGAPAGPSVAGTFTQWLSMLHRAEVFGLPYRILVSVLGAALVILSVAGIAIWMRKRAAANLSKKRLRSPA